MQLSCQERLLAAQQNPLSSKCQVRLEAVKESSFPKGTPTGFGVAKSFSCLLGKHHAVF
jgi:hypothetical protein